MSKSQRTKNTQTWTRKKFGKPPGMVIWNKPRNWSIWVWMSMRRMISYVIMISSMFGVSHFPNLHVSLYSFCSICVYQGAAPLHIAAQKGHCEIVELLIKSGANVNAQNQYVCALVAFEWLLICLFEPMNCVIYFMDCCHWSFLFVRCNDDKKKWTPLHYAALKGHKDTVELLIKHGANVNAQNYCVCALNCCIIFCVLIQHKSWEWKRSHELIQFSSFWTSWQWFDDSTDCDMKITGQNKTPLLFAAQKGFCEVVELLIKSGANVNAQGYEVCSMSCGPSLYGSYKQRDNLTQSFVWMTPSLDAYWSIRRLTEQRNGHHYTRQPMWPMMMMKYAPEKCGYSVFCARTELIPFSRTR